VLLERPVRTERGEVRVQAQRSVLARNVPFIAAVLTLVLHLAGNPHYGFFRDELYFIICGFRPDIGYVDQPSLVPLLAAFSQAFGMSLFALRAIPAIFAALATYIASRFAVELGGGRFAIVVTALVTTFAPEMLAFGSRLSPDTVQMAVWPLIALLVYRMVRCEDPRLWIAVSLITAFGFWAKYSVAFFAFALVIGLLLTPQRTLLRNRWFAGGVALCAALVAPNVWWQWHYHFPMLQLLHNDYDKFMLRWPPFPLQQVMIMSPQLSIVWIIGLGWLFANARTRFLAWAYVVLIAMMWAGDAKAYYPAAVYPYLVAAGAVPIERWTGVRNRWRIAIVAIIVAFAVPSTPFVLPVVPMTTYIKYQEVLGNLFHISFHVGPASNSTPIQYYADMTGWPQLEERVAQFYDALPPAERAKASIYAHNFGEASAIELYGPRDSLPHVLSANNNFWLWGTHGQSGEVVIDVNGRELLKYYRSAKRVDTFYNPLAMPYENNLPIWILRDPKQPLSAVWPHLKNYSYAFGGL
jgi:Dolichyl-phosphate-mannose-protein mannosyltransferase